MVQTRSNTKQESTMVETRLMSKKTDIKSSKQTWKKQTRKKQRRPDPIDVEAMCIFMTEDYLIRHPPISNTECSWEVDFAGELEWRQKSALEKAPFIKIARERRAKPKAKLTFDHHAFSSKEESDAAEATTKLGFKSYWDAVYAGDLENFREHGHTGEVWFGADVMEKVASWTKGLCSDIARGQMRNHVGDGTSLTHEQGENDLTDWSVLDVGTGNGLLLQEFAKKGFTDLTGSDYSEGAIDLARSLADRDGFSSLKFLVDDVLDTKIEKEFQLVVDKGTLDAIGVHHHGLKFRRMYWDSMLKLVAPGGLLVITSCERTKDLLVQEVVYDSEYRFKSISGFSYIDHIDSYSTFKFGGLVGSCVVTVAFVRK